MRFPLYFASRGLFLGLTVLGAGLVFTAGASAADRGKIVVQVDKPGAKISPTFYGLMTEEINHSYDGGLYGELIQNRIFKNSARGNGPVPHWSVVHSEGAQGAISLDTADPVNRVALTTSLRLNIRSLSAGQRVGVANDGFWGIPVRPDSTYQASFYAKGSNGFRGPLTVAIESNDGKTIHASAIVPAIGEKWQKYHVALKTGRVEPSAANRFVISAASRGDVNFNLVSLFPPTYKDRPNGNRADISQLLAEMKPAFLRFPGGAYLEGNDLSNRWNWKATIGPLEDRPGHGSMWGYRSSDGMGMLEFMAWCEEIGMEPVLAVFAGYTLNHQTVPAAEYPKYAQEAVEAIEYLSGGVSSAWGARRAKDGHPAPLKVNYVEIGNEDPAGPNDTYARRFPVFYDIIKAKYPKIQVISTVRGGYGNRVPDVIDEHYYMDFKDAMNKAHMYDKRPRSGPKVFVGEWATRDNKPTPSFQSALGDAAFLTGLERNADVVIMSCYAPLFVNVNPGGQQWATDLIGYNALVSFGSPSYYVQKMFYCNKGDVVLPITLTPSQAMFASASRDEATGDVILKLVNAAETPQEMEISLQGAATIGKTARMEVLAGGLTDVNSVAQPMKVAPQASTIAAAAKSVRVFPGHTVNVIRFSTK